MLCPDHTDLKSNPVRTPRHSRDAHKVQDDKFWVSPRAYCAKFRVSVVMCKERRTPAKTLDRHVIIRACYGHCTREQHWLTYCFHDIVVRTVGSNVIAAKTCHQ